MSWLDLATWVSVLAIVAAPVLAAEYLDASRDSSNGQDDDSDES